MCLPHNDVQTLVDTIYPGIDQGNMSDQFFLERTILSPKNDAVDQLNHLILDRFPGQETILMGIDRVNKDTSHVYPTEFLNSLNASGLPLVLLSSLAALLCCSATLIHPMVFVMAHAWHCWTSEQGVLHFGWRSCRKHCLHSQNHLGAFIRESSH